MEKEIIEMYEDMIFFEIELFLIMEERMKVEEEFYGIKSYVIKFWLELFYLKFEKFNLESDVKKLKS